MNLKRVSRLWTALPMCLVLTAAADAVVYQVPGDYNTIQDAVDAAAAIGDRIEVSSVISQENVLVVDKDIEIVAMATPIVVGSFSWTNPGGQAIPAGGLVEGFHVMGDVTTSDIEHSFTAKDLVVDGAIDVDSGSGAFPEHWQVVGCMAGQDISVTGLLDENGGGVSISNCRSSGSISARGLQPSIADCELTGLGYIVCEAEDTGSVSGCIVPDGHIQVIGFSFGAHATSNVVTGGDITLTSNETTAINNVVHGGDIYAGGDVRARCIGNKCFDGDIGVALGPAKDFALIEGNLVVRCRSGIYSGDRHTIIRSNTVVDCTAEGIRAWDDEDVVEQNIVVGCGIGIQLVDAQTAACNDVWGNTQNWVGAPDQEGINGNFSVDPLFCDPDADDYTLANTSTCLPGNHPDGNDCGLIGAFGEGCSGPVPVIDASWGGVKSRFRR
jgi:hypothetical protein